MSAIIWCITVIDRDANRVLFAGKTPDRAELEAVAAEARRLRPMAKILIRPPMGAELYEWEGQS